MGKREREREGGRDREEERKVVREHGREVGGGFGAKRRD